MPRDEVDEIYLDESYYLVPDDKVGLRGLRGDPRRHGERKPGRAGARRACYRRERLLMLEPRGKGIAATALRYSNEVRDEDELFRRDPEREGAARHAQARRAHSRQQEGRISIPTKFEDRYEDALTAI